MALDVHRNKVDLLAMDDGAQSTCLFLGNPDLDQKIDLCRLVEQFFPISRR